MKKHFAKPILSRCEIRLNENIALSWEWYINSTATNTYHFTHYKEGSYTEWGTDIGCYDYYSGNYEWSTSETGAYGLWFHSPDNIHYAGANINNWNAMTEWMGYMDYLDTTNTYNCMTAPA